MFANKVASCLKTKWSLLIYKCVRKIWALKKRRCMWMLNVRPKKSRLNSGVNIVVNEDSLTNRFINISFRHVQSPWPWLRLQSESLLRVQQLFLKLKVPLTHAHPDSFAKRCKTETTTTRLSLAAGPDAKGLWYFLHLFKPLSPVSLQAVCRATLLLISDHLIL